MKKNELFHRLNEMGWKLARIRGSHHVFTHPDATRSIPVPVHGKEIDDHIARAILKQADAALKKAD